MYGHQWTLVWGSLLSRDSQCLSRVSVGGGKLLQVSPEQQLGSPTAFLQLWVWSTGDLFNQISFQ